MKTFDNVAALKLASLQAGQRVSTKGYYTNNDGGQAEYYISDTAVADEYGDHTIVNGNVAELAITDGILKVKQYGAMGNAFNPSGEIDPGTGDPYNYARALQDDWHDDSLNIQAAINKALLIPMFNPVVKFPPGGFAITRPMQIWQADGLILEGCGRMSSCLVPVGAMTPVLNDYFIGEQERQNALYPDPTDPGVNYDTEIAAILVSSGRRTLSGNFRPQTGRASWMLTFRDMGMTGFACDTQPSFIYGSEFAHSYISNIYVEFGHALIKAWDMYRLKVTQCDVQVSYTPVDHYSPWSQENSIPGHDGTTTGLSTGTSCHFDACGAAFVTQGWFLRHLSYSSMSDCAIDGWGWQPDGYYDPADKTVRYAYQLERCVGFNMISCGAESARPSEYLNSGAINVYGGDEATMNIQGGIFLAAYRDDFDPEVDGYGNVFDGLAMNLNAALVSATGDWIVKRGELSLNGMAYSTPDGQFKTADYTLKKPGQDHLNTRWMPSILTHGRLKCGIALNNITSAVLPSTGDTFITFSAGEDNTGYDPYPWGILDNGNDKLTAPFSGWFVLLCNISYTGLNAPGFYTTLTRTDDTTQSLSQQRFGSTLTDATGTISVNVTVRMNKGDYIQITPLHSGDGGYITRISTSFYQM